jgi:hypothetical protein
MKDNSELKKEVVSTEALIEFSITGGIQRPIPAQNHEKRLVD